MGRILEISALKFRNHTDSYQWERSFCSIDALRNITNAVRTSSLLIYFGILYVLDSMTSLLRYFTESSGEVC